MPQLTFKRNAHISFFKRCLTMLPSAVEGYDGNRITMAYFCLSALDLLGALETSYTAEERQDWVNWVWALQKTQGGFSGSTFMTSALSEDSEYPQQDPLMNPGHLPSTYTSLLVLGILRAPVEEWINKLDVDGLERFLDTCADSNGSFSPIPLRLPQPTARTITPLPYSPPFQSDARMAYCAAVIDDMITRAKYHGSGTSGTVDENTAAPPKEIAASDCDLNESVARSSGRRSMKRTRQWLTACQTWEGGFGQHPSLEAQGGTTYCAIASLQLMRPSESREKWNSCFDVDAATRYLVSRQLDGKSSVGDDEAAGDGGGFQGRPGKLEDVCYSFWCGGAMRVLLGKAMFDTDANSRALLDAQSPIGGFGKARGDRPDPYHAYLAIAALAMNENEEAFDALEPAVDDRGHLSGAKEDTTETARRSVPKIGLKALDPLWNVSMETRRYIEECLQAIFRRRYAGQGPTV